MNSLSKLSLLLYSLLCGFCISASAQMNELFVPEHLSAEWQNELLEDVVTQLENSGTGDPLPRFFIEKIERHCDDDSDCLWESYWVVVDELNAQKKYFEGIPLTDKLVEIAEERNDVDGEILALRRLMRFYVFLEDQEMKYTLARRIIKLHEQQGEIGQALYLKTVIAEGRAAQFGEVDEAIAQIKALMAEADRLGLDNARNKILTRLQILYEAYDGYTEELYEVVEAVEKIPISDPIKHLEYRFVYHALSGRANLYRLEKKYDQAEDLYQKVLEVAKIRFGEKRGDLWFEIKIMHELVGLELERGDTVKANEYLDEAYQLAVEFKMHDHILYNLKKRVELAEIKGQYEDALEYTRALHGHKAMVDSISAEFDIKRYYTQLANERLEAEKTSQALELKVKNNQLIILLLGIAFVLLVAGGLLWGYRRQQRDKQVLQGQNQLIQEQAEQLRNQDKAKTRFFANVSHELRTPLTLMSGPIDTLLSEGRFSAEESRLLKIAKRNGNHLKQLIDRILNLQKIEAGKMEIQAQPASLASFFRTHLAQFESLAASKGIQYTVDIDIAKELTAALDQPKCREILNNLLSNAFKFTPPDGRITVSVALENQELEIRVADTGAGIHPDDLPHVFDHYFQTKRQEKAIAGGTGIGLALCREYAELFGGDISIESGLEKGTTVALSFPIDLLDQSHPVVEQVYERQQNFIPEAPLMAAPKTNTNGAQHQRPKILVVEDNPDLSDYLKLLLSGEYEVITAEHGQEAWDELLTDGGKASARDVQLILSDLMMPVMDGFQLLEKLKATDVTRHIPVVMLTARDDVRDKLKALRIGVDDYLTKPFEKEELRVRISNLLKNRTVRQAIMQETEDEISAPVTSNEDQIWLEKLEIFVQQNLSNDLLSVPMLAEQFTMSQSTLLRQLKRLTGLSPIQYLKAIRLEKARQLIQDNTHNSIAKVAFEIGYSDPDSFSRAFKRRYGKTPSEFMDS